MTILFVLTYAAANAMTIHYMACPAANCDDEFGFEVEWIDHSDGPYRMLRPNVVFTSDTCPNGHPQPDDALRERFEREIYEGALDEP